MWYGSEPSSSVNLIEVSVDRVNEIIALNRKGIKADKLLENTTSDQNNSRPNGFTDGLLDEGSLTRFDKKGGKTAKRKKSRNRNRTRPSNE